MVLEWTNHECPYVGKHYRGKNMQALQKKWTGQGVVWLSIISSAPGREGYVSPQQANKLTAERGAAPTAVLLDPTGKVGHAYGARATPHMYVINGEGMLVYAGGIDDQPSARLEDLKIAKNFVDQALRRWRRASRFGEPLARLGVDQIRVVIAWDGVQISAHVREHVAKHLRRQHAGIGVVA